MPVIRFRRVPGIGLHKTIILDKRLQKPGRLCKIKTHRSSIIPQTRSLERISLSLCLQTFRRFQKIEIEKKGFQNFCPRQNSKEGNGRARPRRRPEFRPYIQRASAGPVGCYSPVAEFKITQPRRAPRALRTASPGTSVSRPLTQKWYGNAHLAVTFCIFVTL